MKFSKRITECNGIVYYVWDNVQILEILPQMGGRAKKEAS
jgi:hypothetical protein